MHTFWSDWSVADENRPKSVGMWLLFFSYKDHFILTELSAAHLHCMSNAPFNAVFEALCRKVPLILALEVPCPKWPPVDLVNSRSLYANGIDNNDWLFVHGLPPFLESFYLQVALVTYLWGSFFLYLVVVPSTNLFGICSPTNLAFISPSHFISARQAKIWLATTPHKAISRKRSVQIFETYSKHTAHLFFCETVTGQTILWNHELINFKIKNNERKTKLSSFGRLGPI